MADEQGNREASLRSINAQLEKEGIKEWFCENWPKIKKWINIVCPFLPADVQKWCPEVIKWGDELYNLFCKKRA